MIFAFDAAARRNRQFEMAEDLIVSVIGSQGSQESVDNRLDEWMDR
jgi:hypothetical protein